VALLASLILSLVTGLELLHVLPHYAVALSPHPHHGDVVIHPAFDVSFDVARVGTAVLLFFILAMLTSVVATQLKGREEQLLAAADEALGLKRRLEGVLDASQAGVGLLDLSGRVVWGNRRYHEWVSRSDREVEQAEAHAGGADDGREGSDPPRVLRASAAEAVREARVAHSEASFTKPDGQLQHVLVSAAPILGKDGKVAQVVEVVHDVSRLKEAQAQLVLAGKLAALGELAGRIAHEINNPVGIIQAKLEILLDDDLPPRLREELGKMLDLGRRATTTARNLLSLVRPSDGARVSTDLSPLVRRSLDLVDGLFHGHGIALELDIQDGLRPVRCNQDAINQVLLNLLTNATQAMPDGGRLQVTLMPVTREGRRLAAIVVADTGPGIPPAVRPHLFEPFFTTKPAGIGTGLGLANSMGIVRDHGGTIEVDSPVEGGSRFAVLLPEADDERA
jgi:two-component system NtrC family sensor kinase